MNNNKDTLLFVYGSLRQFSTRGYNFNRFGGQKFVGFHSIKGYKMVDLGAYPAIMESKNEDIIHGEIHSVADNSFEKIKNMEIGAGYTHKTFDFGGKTVSMFTLDNKNNKYKTVDSGNWN